ncbi:hypothetical protein E4U61_005158 [Claviceps capensis]|nr:hypothetical protein E4U61_005158 [Claviceps capensis]
MSRLNCETSMRQFLEEDLRQSRYRERRSQHWERESFKRQRQVYKRELRVLQMAQETQNKLTGPDGALQEIEDPIQNFRGKGIFEIYCNWSGSAMRESDNRRRESNKTRRDNE